MALLMFATCITTDLCTSVSDDWSCNTTFGSGAKSVPDIKTQSVVSVLINCWFNIREYIKLQMWLQLQKHLFDTNFCISAFQNRLWILPEFMFYFIKSVSVRPERVINGFSETSGQSFDLSITGLFNEFIGSQSASTAHLWAVVLRTLPQRHVGFNVSGKSRQTVKSGSIIVAFFPQRVVRPTCAVCVCGS